ncbi:MAG: competence protein ComEC, partial [Alphaproteobacteria bacterium HGW-Alphaproteobacteria-16]
MLPEDVLMAELAASARSTGFRPLQIAGRWWVSARPNERLEAWLEAERGQLFLWVPVMLGVGVAAWFALPDASRWGAVMLAGLALAAAGLAGARGGRGTRVLAVAALLVALGCALIWWRAERVAAPVLAGPAIVAFEGKVERVEAQPARDMV